MNARGNWPAKVIKAPWKALAALASTVLLLSNPAAALPVSIVEGIDAGDSLATALDARQGVVGSTVELAISGSLSLEPATLDFVDIYYLDVLSSLFRASTGDGSSALLIADPVLYLFDSAGRGVAMDDETGGFGQAFLELIGPLVAGDYYLAIAFAGVTPLDAFGNEIFDAFGTGAVLSADALGSWNNAPFAVDPGIPGAYEISTYTVPEPGSLLLALLGLIALLVFRPASHRGVRPYA